VTVEVEVLETDTIEHSLGKARRLLDHRPKG
jgi:phenylacetate-coenzyme A ligase PaaK-like adenylate-forming protein